MRTRWRVLGLVLGGLVVPSSSASPPLAVPTFDSRCAIDHLDVLVDGRPGELTDAGAGDRIEVAFEVPPGCVNRLTLVSFVAPAPAFDGSRLDDQVVHERESGWLASGRHSLSVEVFDFAPIDPAECAAERSAMHILRAAMADDRPRPAAERSGHGAVTGPIDVSCDGPQVSGRPCDGCVGNADDKVPPPQAGDGTDPDAGHECDRNEGIGDGNPAHSACPNFQIDLAYRPTLTSVTGRATHADALVFGLFCVRTTGECYLTDNTPGAQLTPAPAARSLP